MLLLEKRNAVWPVTVELTRKGGVFCCFLVENCLATFEASFGYLYVLLSSENWSCVSINKITGLKCRY